MHIPKRYFHDRLVLVLLSVDTFLALLCSVLIGLQLSNKPADIYIVQYRSNLISQFKSGGIANVFSFILFALLVLVFHVLMSIRVYSIKRQFSIVILGMATLLLTLAIIISNALLVLH